MWLEEEFVVAKSKVEVLLFCDPFGQCKRVFVCFWLMILELEEFWQNMSHFSPINLIIWSGRTKCWDFNVQVTSNNNLDWVSWLCWLPTDKVVHGGIFVFVDIFVNRNCSVASAVFFGINVMTVESKWLLESVRSWLGQEGMDSCMRMPVFWW